MRKIITICGSYKFTKELISCYQELTDQGYIVLFPAMGCEGHDKSYYMRLHFDKIAMSDAIYVVNVGGYIGESVREEINYAKEHNKEILYFTDKDRT